MAPSVGDPDLNVSFGSLEYYEHRLGRDEVILCPPLPDNVVWISVFAHNGFSQYDVIVEEFDPPIVSPHQQFAISNDQLQKIGDGQKISYTGDAALLYRFLKFSLVSSNLSCSLHAEAFGDLTFSLFWDGQEYLVTPSRYNGRSFLDVSLCEYMADFPADIVISFSMNATTSDHSLFVTTANKTTTLPLHSLYLLDAANILTSNSYVTIPDILPCGVSRVWSSISSSPFNPPFDFLFSSNVTFSNITWSLPNRSQSDNHVIYTYLLLEDTFEGSAQEVMNAFSYSVGPGLVDKSGRRLADIGEIGSAVKEEIICDENISKSLFSEMEIALSIIVGLDKYDSSSLYGNLTYLDILQSNVTWLACGQQIEFMGYSNKMDLCGDWNCTKIYFENYMVNKNQIESGSCDTSSIVIDSNLNAAWYKQCKESVYSVSTGKIGRPCVSDDDCLFPWSNLSLLTYSALNQTCSFDIPSDSSQCDTFRGVCTDTQESSENHFWWCFVNNMTLDLEITLSLLHIDPCNISQLKESFSTNDCVSVSGTGMAALKYRTKYQYFTFLGNLLDDQNQNIHDPIRSHCGCSHSVGSEYELCEDLLCNKPPPCEYTSYDRAPRNLLFSTEGNAKSGDCSYSFIYQASDSSSCLEVTQCNWNPLLSNNSNDMADCVYSKNSTMFCGAHFDPNDEFFVEIYNVTQNDCNMNGGNVCVSPLGSLVFGELTNENCLNTGYCSVTCFSEQSNHQCLPVDLSQPSLCYNDSFEMNQIFCEEMSGTWDGERVCTFPLQNNLIECERNRNIFISCDSLNVNDCEITSLLSCYLSNSTSLCHTKYECEKDGVGQCSNADYFVNFMTSPPTFGSCVVPFQIDNSQKKMRHYCYQNTIPLTIGFATSFSHFESNERTNIFFFKVCKPFHI